MVLGRDPPQRPGGVPVMEEPEEARMRKERAVKDDGRYIVFYSFEEEGDSANDVDSGGEESS